MRIAYVGNFGPPFSTESDIRWTLEDMGHSVLALQESTLEWDHLPRLVEGCDLFMWTRTAGFDPPDPECQRRAIEAIEVPTVGFHLDRWWGLRRESTERGPASPDPSPFFHLDYLFTSDGGHEREWKEVGANHFWSPPAIARRNGIVGRFRRHLWAEVGFVGNLRHYAHDEWGPYRRELYRRLSTLPKFRLWESGARGQLLADIYASVTVVIGDSCLAGGATHYYSDRIPETLGRSGFLLHPEVEGLRDQFPEGTLITYRLGDWEQLFELIAYYVAHPEEARITAEVGRGWVLDHHLYEHRLARIFEVLREHL